MGLFTSPAPPARDGFNLSRAGAARVGRLGVVCLLVFQLSFGNAQTQGGLKVTVLEGEGAINNIQQMRAKEPVVQVTDENDAPVKGATVTFMLPEAGAGGTFGPSGLTLTIQSDERGQATGKGLAPNKTTGQFEIRVIASQGGRTGRATITQTNAAPAVAKGGSKGLLWLIIIAGAAGGGAAAALGSKKSSSSPAAPGPATVITPGTPTLGPPR